MQPLAKAIQSQGRGNDSMLVHMTPSEVGGLQTLAQKYNRSLSINPSTGLPEAGFLEDILPTLAGAALVAGSGGALSPLVAAGLVGGGTALVTGDVEKGLMAGLGAYGGGGLGQGLTAAGAATAPTNVVASGADATTTAATGADVVGSVGMDTISAATPTNIASISPGGQPLISTDLAQVAQTTPIPTPGNMNPAIGSQTPRNLAGINSAGQGIMQAPIDPKTLTMGENFSLAGKGFTNLGSEAGREAFVKGLAPGGKGTVGDVFKYSFAGASPLLAQDPYEYKKKTGKIKNYDYDPGTQDVSYRTGARGEDTDELRYFRPRFFAMGGLANLNNRGEYLKGMGDGMSDTIPANINNVQEAALSDGEFVIPADVVSHLGNGSSNAGAKRLYAMMDNIRKERTGKEKQAPAVNVNKVMPA